MPILYYNPFGAWGVSCSFESSLRVYSSPNIPKNTVACLQLTKRISDHQEKEGSDNAFKSHGLSRRG